MSRFMILLGQDSLQAGVLVLAVLLVQKALGKRLAPRWRSGLWLLVMVRLLLLISFGSIVSIFNLLPHASAKTSSLGPPTHIAPPTAIADANFSRTTGTMLTEKPLLQPRPAQLSSPDTSKSVPQFPLGNSAARAPAPSPERRSWNAWVPILFRVWLGGVVCLLGYILAGSLRIHFQLLRMPPISDLKLMELLAECKARMHIRGELHLVESPQAATPALYGFLQPKLLLPPGFAGKFSMQELRFVLLHELAHVERRDILFNWIAAVLQALHWFNPLVWFGFACWRADRELACDALALEASGENQNRAYGQTILRLLDSFSPRASMPGLVGILEDKRQLRRRIFMIANYVPAKKWPLAALLIAGVLAVVGLTDAQNNPHTGSNQDKNENAPLIVSIDTQGTLRLGAEAHPVTVEQLKSELASEAEKNPNLKLAISADKAAPFSQIAKVMDAAKEAKIKMVKVAAKESNPPAADTETVEHALALPPRPVVTDGAEMKVTVLDAATGKPLSGAEVLAPNNASFFSSETENSPHWFTDRAGVVVIRLGKIVPGPLQRRTWFTVSVRHKDYSPRGLSWSGTEEDVRQTMPPAITVRLPRGIVAGGIVHDESGNPVEGVRVRIFGTDSWRGESPQYSEFWSDSRDTPAVVTDSSGHWQVADFPADLQVVRVELTRPGGAMQRFVEEGESDAREPGEPINVADLKANQAVFVLPEGTTISGMVVDHNGKGIGGIRLITRPVAPYPPSPYVFTNNPDGNFELRHIDTVKLLIAAEAANYATKTVTVTPAEKSSDIRIVLPPAKPLRIRVVGESNEPIVGAKVQTIDWRARDQILDWSGQTDDDGLVVWSNAPDRSVAVQAIASNYAPRSANLLADGMENTIRLSRQAPQSISVHLHVVDADSSEPLHSFEVFRDLQWNQGFKSWGQPGRDGEFQQQVNATEFNGGTAPYFVIQIQVAGYAPWTQECYFEDGDLDLVAKLKKAPVPGGIVLQPDGQPAAKAFVMLNLGIFPVSVYPFGLVAPEAGGLTERTAEDGSFHFEAADDDKTIVIRHSSGFRSMTVGELIRAHEVRLQPWASVEGVLRVNGKPLAGETVYLKSPLDSMNMVEDFMLFEQAQADQQGRFSFTNLPPGNYAIYRMPGPIGDAGDLESHRLVFDLHPGEHKQLDYAFSGRDVIGHVSTTVPVDWQHDAEVLVAKVPPVPPAPNRWEYAETSDFKKAKLAYENSPQTLAARREQQEFQLLFDNKGNFHTDGVPPGTYELRLRLTKPPKAGEARIPFEEQEWGSLKKEIVVPAGEGAFDVGSLTMTVNPEAAIKAVAENPAP